MELLAAYLAIDRLQAIVNGQPLPEQAVGAVLFADMVGFTALVELLENQLGRRQGIDVLTRQINQLFDALLAEIHQHQGCVIGFGGDALTAWFAGDDGLRAVACGLAIQQAMAQFIRIEIPSLEPITLTIKVAIAAGSVRRLCVGDPTRQRLDILAGDAMLRLANVQYYAKAGSVIFDAQTMRQIGNHLTVAEWQPDSSTGEQHGLIAAAVHKMASPSVPLPSPYSITAFKTFDPTLLRPWLLRPVYERLVSGQGTFLAEIRPVAALFLRFEGLDYSNDEAIGRKLNAYVGSIQQILDQYKGFLIKFTIDDKGSYLLAAFGAPLGDGETIDRALTAALALRASATEFPFITAVHIGIDQGKVLAGAFGSAARMTYDLLGSAVNRASRYMTAAQPGQILLSAQAFRLLGDRFICRKLPALTIKGVGIVPVYELVGYAPSSPSFADAPFVGREKELHHVHQLLDRAATGQGQILALAGAAGIGKSHFIAQFTEQASKRGWRVVVGMCDLVGQQSPYYPWRQIMHEFLVAERSELSQQAGSAQQETLERWPENDNASHRRWLYDFLSTPQPAHGNGQEMSNGQWRQEQLFVLLCDFLVAEAQKQPLIVVLEDVQWLDEASIQVTKVLSRFIATAPLFLMLAQRVPELTQVASLASLQWLPYYHGLSLGELSTVSMSVLLAKRLQGQPTPLLVDFVQTYAQGNPFFAEELAGALQEIGCLAYERATNRYDLDKQLVDRLWRTNGLLRDPITGNWALRTDTPLATLDLGLPTTLHAAVLTHVDQLDNATQLTVKVAAVVGHYFSLDVLAAAHPFPPTPTALQQQVERLLDQGLIALRQNANGDFAFKHHITQEVIYDLLVGDQRTELHGRVGVALEALFPQAVEQLAYHYQRSNVRDKALVYLEQAASKAQGDYANQTALTYYDQALALEERLRWLWGKAEVLHSLGRRAEQQAILDKLSQQPTMPAPTLTYLYGQYYEAIGQYEFAQIAAEKARQAAAQQANRAEEARCLALLSLIARRQGNYAQAKIDCEQGLVLLLHPDQEQAAETPILIELYLNLGNTYRQQGAYQEAQSCCQRLLTLCRESGHRRGEAEALNILAAIAYYQRDFKSALHHSQQVLQIQRKIGALAGEGTTLANLAAVSLELGLFEEAEKLLMAALPILQQTENRAEEINTHNLLGILHYQLGEFDQAHTAFRLGLELCESNHDGGKGYLLCNLGLLLREEGKLRSANAKLQDALRLAEAQGNLELKAMCCSHLALVHALEKEWTTAIQLAHTALDLRHQLKAIDLTTIDLTTLAQAHWLMGKKAQALTYVEQTLILLHECNNKGPEFPQRDYFLCYQILSAAEQKAKAATALQTDYTLVIERVYIIQDTA